MKVNSVKWGECPKCNVTLNGYDFYPANILMTGQSSPYSLTHCPRCHNQIMVSAKITLEFDCKGVDNSQSECDNT